MSSLAQEQCKPCQEGAEPLKGEELQKLASELDGWEVVDEHHLHKVYKQDDWSATMEKVNQIGKVAEKQNHHPDLEVHYGKVGVTIYTHKIDGLTRSDFVLAAKIDEPD